MGDSMQMMHRGYQKFEGGTGVFEKFECHLDPVKMPNIEGQPHPLIQKGKKMQQWINETCRDLLVS